MDCTVPRTPALTVASPIPIAQLSPAVEDQGQRCFRGTVVLLWPYSSSTKQFRVLLSEPDFRLRSSHGQVRIIFQGASAEVVAKSQIGIGDTVLLGLDGVRWCKKEDEVESRTGELDWSLVYGSRVVLEIYRGANLFGTVDVTAPQEEHNKEDGVPEDAPVTATSPKPPTAPPQNLESPSVSRLAALPFYLDDDFSYTEEEDGYISGKGRKRTKWGRPSSEWVFVDSPPSPIKETGDWNTDELDFDAEVDKDIGMQDQASVRVTSPTSLQPASEEDRRVDGVQSPDLRPSAEDAQPVQDQVAPIREHQEEPPTPEPAGAQDSLEICGPRSLADSQTATVDKPSKFIPVEDSAEATIFELDTQTTQRRTPSPIQHQSELTATSREIDEQETQEALSESHPTTTEITQFEPDSTEIFEPSEGIPAQHLEGEPVMNLLSSGSLLPQTLMSSQEVVSGGSFQTESDTHAVASYSNVFESFTGQPTDQETFNLELKEESQGLDLYDRTPQPEYNYENEVQEDWTEGPEKQSPEAEEKYYSEEYMDEDAEPAAEEYMSEISESAESPSDLEVEEYIPEDEPQQPTPQPAQVPTQPDVIVIDSDSDDEPEMGGPRAVDVSGTSSPTREDAEMYDEHSGHDEERRDSPGPQTTDVTFDDHRMLDVPRQDEEHAEAHAPQGNADKPNYLGLDGSVEYEPSLTDQSFRPVMSGTLAHENKTHRSQTPTLIPAPASLSTETAIESPRFRSWSIPVRTIPLQSNKSKWGKTLHTGTQMMTPGGTQETANSQSQELSPTSPTTHNLLTPQFSQKSRSVTSNTDTSDIEIPSEDDRKEPSDKESTPLARQTVESPLATGALIEPSDGYPTAMTSETPELEKDTTETVESSSETPRGPNAEDAGPQDQREAHELAWPIAAGLGTRLAYFCPFSLLSENYNSAVDTISIVASATPVLRGTRKPRDYFTTLQLLDPSTSGTTMCAQLFRRQKDALPVASKGDVILLRNFKVRTMDDKPVLCTMGHSSWVVFIQGNEQNVQINGPAVKYNNAERACVSELRQWYVEEGAALIEKNESLQTNRDDTETASTPSSRHNEKDTFRKYRRAKNSTGRRLTVHYLRHGRRYTDFSSADNVHKLRDGKLYAHP